MLASEIGRCLVERQIVPGNLIGARLGIDPVQLEHQVLNGTRVRHPGGKRLGDSVVSLGLPSKGFGRQYREIRRQVRITRAMGSATLSLTYVANGRFDAYVQWSKLSLWDICAAGVIALEGGAVVTSCQGTAWFELGMPSKSIGIAAASPQHHQAYLDLLVDG